MPAFASCFKAIMYLLLHNLQGCIFKGATKLQPPHEACNFIIKETVAQVFSYEFCVISKNTFFTEHIFFTLSEKKWLTNI